MSAPRMMLVWLAAASLSAPGAHAAVHRQHSGTGRWGQPVQHNCGHHERAGQEDDQQQGGWEEAGVRSGTAPLALRQPIRCASVLLGMGSAADSSLSHEILCTIPVGDEL